MSVTYSGRSAAKSHLAELKEGVVAFVVAPIVRSADRQRPTGMQALRAPPRGDPIPVLGVVEGTDQSP